ncbi:MAG TPA: hypothetical protein VF806_10525, partial [Anaerolineaceae bacterium]
KDQEGPWKLVAYLDEIQPSIAYEEIRYPSYSIGVLIDHLIQQRPAQGATVSRLREELLSLAGRAIQAEREHMLKSFQQLLDRSEETLETQRQERFEALDNFIDSLPDRQQEGAPLRVQELSDELSGLVRLPQFRLTAEQMRSINEDPDTLRSQLREQIDAYVTTLTINRVVGAMERRLGESMNIRPNQFLEMEWVDVSDALLHEVDALLDRRYERLLGDGKAISRDMDPLLERLTDYTTDKAQLLDLLGVMTEGQRLVFDRRTHRQGYQLTHRLNYAFLVGQMLQDRPAQDVTDQVLEQLDAARDVLRLVWGRYEWSRLSQEEVTLSHMDERLKARIQEGLGEDNYARICDQPLNTLTEQDRQAVQDVFGWFDQNEATRQLLLGVISELWVDYLTRVEALRVSIGLEAYAQRDPLVQYKGRASEMFQQLLADIRIGVISRLFTFRPRPQSMTAAEGRPDGAASLDPAAVTAVATSVAPAGTPAEPVSPGGQSAARAEIASGKKKRRRH